MEDATAKLRKFADKGGKEYSDLLLKLIIEGAMKMDEPLVTVRCRKADASAVRGLLAQAQRQVNGKRAALKQQDASKGQGLTTTFDVSIKMADGPKAVLPAEGPFACSGGVVLVARGGRIVCDNTLDERLNLAFQGLLPVVNHTLFPEDVKA